MTAKASGHARGTLPARLGRGIGAAAAMLLAACGAGGRDGASIDQYLEFYYPSTGDFNYEIVHDWGLYLIHTGADAGEELSPDSETYRGYVVMRPETTGSPPEPAPAIYLTTPEGAVWTRPDDAAIPIQSERTEVVVEQTEHGTQTTETTIRSIGEPVIDDFLANPQNWTRYGDLQVSGGRTRLTRTGGPQ